MDELRQFTRSFDSLTFEFGRLPSPLAPANRTLHHNTAALSTSGLCTLLEKECLSSSPSSPTPRRSLSLTEASTLAQSHSSLATVGGNLLEAEADYKHETEETEEEQEQELSAGVQIKQVCCCLHPRGCKTAYLLGVWAINPPA